jgi:PAS domain S-box-containing protein
VTRSITYEQRFVRKDGTLMWTQVTVSRTDGPHGGPGHCVSIAEDISQRKQLEDALRQSATEAADRAGELQAVFDAMVDAVTLYDAEGRAIHENAADRELFGINAYTPRYHALPLHERLSLYHLHTPSGRTLRPDEYPAVRALRGEVIKGTSAVDLVVHTLDGRERVVSTSGAPVRDAEGRITGAICIYHDVTDRYELQRAMTARANLLQTVFESMTDALLVYSRDGQIVQMNSAARVIFGHDHDPEFQSRPLGERLTQMSLRDEEERLLPQERWPQTRVLRGEVLTGAETVELSVRTVDGRDVPISVTGAPVRDHAGALVGAVCVARDVTSRRQLERQKDEFLGIASHELRTPLTSIKVLAQLIAETLAASPLDELERPAQLMLQAISRMERLVGDLLDASRIHAGTLAMRPTACDLAAICRQQAEEQAAATGRTLRLELPAEPLVIDADADRMGQVVANLLSNALKYSAAVYPVSLRLQRTDGQALLAVTDHGPGIPEEARPQLFERFYRVPNIEVLSGSGVGIGLGLYITREMVQRHGGRIWLESEVGQGSTFIVALPLRLGTADQREARRDSEASMTTAATRQSSQVCTNLTPRPPSLAGTGEPGGTADGRGGGLGRPFPLHVGLTSSGC